MATAAKVTVDTPSANYMQMSSDWAMISALLGGTKAMRAAGQAYLPKFDAEPDANYSNRLNRSTLTGYFERTCTFLTGKPFSKPIVLGEDMAEPIVEYAEDIDLQGNNLDSFAWKVFFDGLAKGLTHVLVEYPKQEAEAETLADEREIAPRPYWCHIPAEDLIAAYSKVVNGEEVLTHVRYRYSEIERVGYEEKVNRYVMVLEPGRWERHQYDEGSKEWKQVAEGKSDIDKIPLVTFYAGKREGLMLVKPPLLDLAYLNVTHWQSSSDQRNILTVSRFPILGASGLSKEEAVGVVVGPNRLIALPDPQAKLYYVEHGGAAIKAGAEDLAQLAEDMQMYGVEMLMPRTGSPTATARALDSAEMQSPLQMMVYSFKDCLEEALVHTADWADLDEKQAGSVNVNTEFGLSARVQSDTDALLKARALGDISRETLLTEMKRRGILSADFDPEADLAASELEPPDDLDPDILPPGKDEEDEEEEEDNPPQPPPPGSQE